MMSERLIEHWEQHQETCEKGLKLAEENLGDLYLKAMGQLALDLYPTNPEITHDGEW
jgi:hypothetical protein